MVYVCMIAPQMMCQVKRRGATASDNGAAGNGAGTSSPRCSPNRLRHLGA